MSRGRHKNRSKQADAPSCRPARSIVLSAGLAFGMFAAYLGIWRGAQRNQVVNSAPSAVSMMISAASQPSPVSVVTLDQARKDPSKRQPYLDRICGGYGLSAIYDHDQSLYNARYAWIGKKFSPSAAREEDNIESLPSSGITSTVMAAVPSTTYYVGRCSDENVFVFDRFFKSGLRIIKGESNSIDFEIIGSVSPDHGSQDVYMIQTDDDAISLVVGHEGAHLKELREGISYKGRRFDSSFINQCKLLRRDLYDSSRELGAFMSQLRGYSGKMNNILWIWTFGKAKDCARKLRVADIPDPQFKDYVNDLGDEALRELPRYSPRLLNEFKTRK